MFSAILQYDRAVPDHWREQLHAITPPFQRVSWLELFWESGNSGNPVHRWVIYEATPAHAVHPLHREILLEEPVESAGHQRMLNYFRETGGCLIQPFWVIQGDRGGHKVEFSDAEAKLLYHQGLDYQPPAAGALSYANFDSRVLSQIMRWDKLRRGYATIQEAGKRGEEQLERRFREELLGWLEPQLLEAIADQHHRIDYDSIREDVNHEPDFDALTHQWVETGVIGA